VQFFYHISAKEPTLNINHELYRHIIKSRRTKTGDMVLFRNLRDDVLYSYVVDKIDKNTATMSLKSSEQTPPQNANKLHIGWCITDPKNISHTIAQLNELNLHKLTFIYCKYSQKNFNINIDKLNKILINSSCQCGRIDTLKIDISESLTKFHATYQDSYVVHFSDNHISTHKQNIKNIIIGCEGGFDDDELNIFHKNKIVGLGKPHILKSTTAVVATASLLST
jgi:16S rRNA (uracil1498-N3)-methyltransferase